MNEYRKGQDGIIHRVMRGAKPFSGRFSKALCGEKTRTNRVMRDRDAESSPNRCQVCDTRYKTQGGT